MQDLHLSKLLYTPTQIKQTLVDFSMELNQTQGSKMKKGFILLGLLMVVAHATAIAKPINMLIGSGFSAPNVNGETNISNPQTGDIVFDTISSGFFGYSGTTWLSFGGVPATYTQPTVQKFTSGSGTYTLPSAPAPLYIKVKMVGGGGGGGGGNNITTGTAGGTSTFGTSFLSANGGAGAATPSISSTGGLGGTVSSSGVALAVVFLQGGSGGAGAAGILQGMGGTGGVSFFGGAASGGTAGSGGNAIANSGSGGGGGSVTAGGLNSGNGGGAGGYVEAIIQSPASTYSFAVGAGGAGAAGGTNGNSGGGGGSGVIIVEEYYQ